MQKRNRKNSLLVYFSDDEIRILNAKWKMSGLRSRSAFIRQLIIYGNVYDIDYKYLREYNAKLSEISRSLNQIAKRVIVSNNIYEDDIKEIKKEIEEIWHIQEFILSKQPLLEQ